MIGKIKRGKSFGGVCDYVLRQNKQVPGRIIGGNMVGQTATELTREFELVARFNSRVKVPVKHFSLSFAESDGIVSDDTKSLLAMDYMERMGYGNSQYLIVSHDRTDHDHAHDHMHIVANVVAVNGLRVDGWLDWQRSQTVLRELEREHNLTPVISSWDKNRDKLAATKHDRRVERLKASGVQPDAIERTHAEIQSKIDLAAKGATSMTQFCGRLQALEIDPIARITRTGRVQGISYRSGDVVVRGSDLVGASFPALQQRGIKFDPARDLANLKSAVKGERLEVDREWLENLPVISEEENLVTAAPVFTHPEIPIIPIVTTESEVAPSNKYDQAQERLDADLIYVAAEYPDLKQTPEYQAAAKRANARYQERLKSMPKQVVGSTPATEPVTKKWEHTLQQATDRRLVESILAAAQELGADDYRAGNYRVRILEEQIEVEYQDKLAMVINVSSDEAQSQLIGLSNTINQYERGLGGAIAIVLTDLEQQRSEDKEREQQRQSELQQELERQQQQLERQIELERIQQLERELDPNMDFSNPSPNVNFSDPDREIENDYDWSR
ncbi:relaxase/mobilization nuclease domain-containing protein [Chamaesiphon sp.]|uniref:relaxase/mobilization nuclease domain-containing protein n=1 Tax=Chamaesiphon sp. TaxID=2814140 RepID=UPI003593F4F1